MELYHVELMNTRKKEKRLRYILILYEHNVHQWSLYI